MICDLIFRVIFKKESPIEPAYLAEVLRTSELRRQIEDRRTGAAPMMQKITKSALNDLSIPIPKPEEQRELVQLLTAARAKAEKQRSNAADTRAAAWAFFGARIYGASATAAVVSDATAP